MIETANSSGVPGIQNTAINCDVNIKSVKGLNKKKTKSAVKPKVAKDMMVSSDSMSSKNCK